MKKTLVALAVTAFAASATAKIDLYNQDGTSVSTDGEAKVVVKKTATKKGNEHSVYTNSNLASSGKIGLNVNHTLDDGFYALGTLKIKLDTKETKVDKVFAGLGHKELGQVTFGKQNLIGDDVGLIGLDNALDVGSDLDHVGGWDILNGSSDSAVAYRYTGIKGLTLGADYNFANGSKEKNGYGAGAIYEFDLAEGTASVSLGYAHKDFKVNSTDTKRDQDGVYGGFAYVINGLKYGVDGGFSVVKHTGNKQKDKLG